jgi:hypothetical protein
MPREASPIPTCPLHQPEGQHNVNRHRSTTPGPHENHLCISDRSQRPTEGAIRTPTLAHHWQPTAAANRLNPEGERCSTTTRHHVTAKSGHPEISSFELRQFHLFTPERFHALLNSLFRVLFNFPSRYLFTIGLVVVFSLWWSLPPTLGCTFKQPDSIGRAAPTCRAPVLRALHPLWARGSRIR